LRLILVDPNTGLVAFLTSIQSWAEAYPKAMQEHGE
jgi:hypothetical protein